MKRILVLLFFSLSFLDAAQGRSPLPRGLLYQPGSYTGRTDARTSYGPCPLASINKAWHEKVKAVQHTIDPKTKRNYNLLEKDDEGKFPITSFLKYARGQEFPENEIKAVLHCMVHCGGCVVMPSDIEYAKQNGYGPLLPPAKR